MSHEAVNLTVHGRVQGVGFRFYVRDKAVKLGVTGWVRNRPEGTVEVHAEASPDILEQFIRAVRIGPTFSHVSDMEIEKSPPTNKYGSFNIAF